MGVQQTVSEYKTLYKEKPTWTSSANESSLFQSLTQQSREEAREEGIEQGERKSTLEDILEVLEIRFNMHESHPVSARIAAIDDLQRLKQLHRAAIQVVSLEAFQHLLDA